VKAALSDWLARIVQGGLFYASELGWSIFSEGHDVMEFMDLSVDWYTGDTCYAVITSPTSREHLVQGTVCNRLHVAIGRMDLQLTRQDVGVDPYD